ncbi:MAG: 3-oxoacyl-[acyl-carrier protein] reductase [Mycobacterium sp.]|nr:3-oxoacyl-[acyl-carrier protein] reductase [Mycobacterium sp.]
MVTDLKSSEDGRGVVVTGAASGFGAAIARRFNLSGARVVVADVDEEGAKQVAAELRDAVAIAVDVTVPEQVQAMIDESAEILGGIDVLVNNAGAAHRVGPMIDLEPEVFDAQFALNLRSVFLGVKYAVPHMPDGSVIVNTASIGGRRPRQGLTVYNAAKGGVITFTRGLAAELAPRIRVCAVNPVGAQTGFIRTSHGVDKLTGETLAAFVKGIPMARLAVPEDVASAVEYLASPEANFLTGVCIDVDGGRSIQ